MTQWMHSSPNLHTVKESFYFHTRLTQ